MQAEAVPRRKTLFLSYLYPSFNGYGTQIRAAALVRMLAAREDVYLVVLNKQEELPGPPDMEMESLCRQCTYMRMLPDAEKGEQWNEFNRDIPASGIERMDVENGHMPAVLKSFYDDHALNSLFVFRIESYFLMEGALDLFPERYLDLDESTFRRNTLIAGLKTQQEGAVADPARQRANLVVRILEKKIIQRFKKVFVSSENEARETSALHGNTDLQVLPNVFPGRNAIVTQAAPEVREILFVGTLSYYPNEDAVRFFCSEIFPLIRKVLGDSVLFRIVGLGCPASLREIESLPGVKLMGYQEDLDPFYASASLLVVPLRAGTGTRLKILEAFTYQRPVVSTSIGAEGLQVRHGENILLADGAGAFAAACLEVMSQPETAARLVKGGLELHGESYSLENLVRYYDRALSSEPWPTSQ